MNVPIPMNQQEALFTLKQKIMYKIIIIIIMGYLALNGWHLSWHPYKFRYLNFKKKKNLWVHHLQSFLINMPPFFTSIQTILLFYSPSLSLSLSLVSVISAVTKKHGWRCSIRRHYKRNQGGSFSRSRAQGEETFMSKVTQIWLFGHRVPQLSWS